MMASPENWPGPYATIRISVAPVGRKGLHLAADHDEERHVVAPDLD
jgi:hypothetical protein